MQYQARIRSNANYLFDTVTVIAGSTSEAERVIAAQYPGFSIQGWPIPVDTGWGTTTPAPQYSKKKPYNAAELGVLLGLFWLLWKLICLPFTIFKWLENRRREHAIAYGCNNAEAREIGLTEEEHDYTPEPDEMYLDKTGYIWHYDGNQWQEVGKASWWMREANRIWKVW